MTQTQGDGPENHSLSHSFSKGSTAGGVIGDVSALLIFRPSVPSRAGRVCEERFGFGEHRPAGA
jgi:hypothetical protein